MYMYIHMWTLDHTAHLLLIVAIEEHTIHRTVIRQRSNFALRLDRKWRNIAFQCRYVVALCG
jgi:hypothetical protein